MPSEKARVGLQRVLQQKEPDEDEVFLQGISIVGRGAIGVQLLPGKGKDSVAFGGQTLAVLFELRVLLLQQGNDGFGSSLDQELQA